MKKHMKLVWEYYRGSVPSLLIIMIIMTFAIYTFVDVLGINNYIGYAKKVYISSSLENALYYIPAKNNDYYMLSAEEQQAQDAVVKKQLLAIDGVEGLCVNRVLTGLYQGKFVNFILYDEEMISRFKLDMSSGEWISPTFTDECVVGGSIFENAEIGDSVVCALGNGTLTVTVAGKMAYPAYIPQMLGGESADRLFKCYDNVIMMYDSSFLREQLNSLGVYVTEYENYFVLLESDISDANRNAVTELLNNTGRYYTYDDIIENTNEVNSYRVKTKLPFPLYAFIISTIAAFSLSLLMTEKKLEEYSIYYIVGCSKKKSICIIATALLIITAVPCLLNILNILIDPYMFRTDDGRIYKDNCYIDNSMIIPILLYMIGMIILTVAVALFTYIKKSPMEIRRRTE